MHPEARYPILNDAIKRNSEHTAGMLIVVQEFHVFFRENVRTRKMRQTIGQIRVYPKVYTPLETSILTRPENSVSVLTG